jgi:hypothetical protein
MLQKIPSAVWAWALKGFAQPKQKESGSDTSSLGRILGIVMLASFFVPTGCTFFWPALEENTLLGVDQILLPDWPTSP